MKKEPHVVVFPLMVATNRRNGIYQLKQLFIFWKRFCITNGKRKCFYYTCAYKNSEEFLIGLVTEKENSKSFRDDNQQVLSSFTIGSFIVIVNSQL